MTITEMEKDRYDDDDDDDEDEDIPVDIENPYVRLATSIRSKFENLSPLSSERCIYRAPDWIRHVNPATYTPQVVSIGPLHHGKESLKPMEEHKMRFLQAHLQRTDQSLESCVEIVKKKEAQLRSCYVESIDFESDELTEIMLVDAIFVIEIMIRMKLGIDYETAEYDDYIFGKPCLLISIIADLLLLENQLPFFILEDLFNPEKSAGSFSNGERPSILELCLKFCTQVVIKSINKEETEADLNRISSSKLEHLVDLLRELHAPSKPKAGKLKNRTLPSITELHQAGVKFKVGSSKNLFDINFSEGILEIPMLILNGGTEVIFRNLLAFEQCHYPNKYMTDYFVIMDNFVNTAKDVDLLVKYGIVENIYGDSSEGANLINRLAEKNAFNSNNFYFADVCEKLDAHCRVPWNTWKANLKQNYFNTPWAIISVIAAVFLLILTVIQTICSVISLT